MVNTCFADRGGPWGVKDGMSYIHIILYVCIMLYVTCMHGLRGVR